MKVVNFKVISRTQSPSGVDCLIASVECEVKRLFSNKKYTRVVVGLQSFSEGEILSTKWFWADTKEKVSPWHSADLSYMAHAWFECKREEEHLREFSDFIERNLYEI